MSHLACPKCRQAVSDDALDAGQCPYCGYDGAMVTAAGAKGAWLIATAAVVVVGVAAGAYLLFPRTEPRRTPVPAVAALAPTPSPPPRRPTESEVAPAPRPVEIGVTSVPQPSPAVVVAPPKKNPWNPAPARRGPVVRIDAKEVREKQIDNPDGVALIPDMNRDDRLTLTGRVRLLKIGSVGGRATLDASKLEAEEIVITGDVNENANVTLNAPNGKVAIGGHVEGSAKLIINAPGGGIVVAAQSGKLDGAAEVTVVAKDLDVKGNMSGNARLIVTLTGGGTAEIGPMQENAAVIYKPVARP